jgi:hypothetical protein
MTINETRKLLGKLAKGISDVEIQKDIKTAVLLKDLFFKITSSKNQSNQLCNNKEDVN